MNILVRFIKFLLFVIVVAAEYMLLFSLEVIRKLKQATQ
jgi:hypothetical protein